MDLLVLPLKKKATTLYFRGGLNVKTNLEDCWSLASLSSTKFPLSSQPSGHQFSLSSRYIDLSCEFPESRGWRKEETKDLRI